MDMDDLREATRVAEKIKRLEDLREDVTARSVDFVENDHVRSIGYTQMEERDIADLKAAMMEAVHDWFSAKIGGHEKELESLGVKVK